MADQDEFISYVIYFDAPACPGRYVVLRWVGMRHDLEPTAVAATLFEARARLPWGLVRIPRAEIDVPDVVETWI